MRVVGRCLELPLAPHHGWLLRWAGLCAWVSYVCERLGCLRSEEGREKGRFQVTFAQADDDDDDERRQVGGSLPPSVHFLSRAFRAAGAAAGVASSPDPRSLWPLCPLLSPGSSRAPPVFFSLLSLETEHSLLLFSSTPTHKLTPALSLASHHSTATSAELTSYTPASLSPCFVPPSPETSVPSSPARLPPSSPPEATRTLPSQTRPDRSSSKASTSSPKPSPSPSVQREGTSSSSRLMVGLSTTFVRVLAADDGDGAVVVILVAALLPGAHSPRLACVGLRVGWLT